MPAARVWLFHCHIDWHLYTGLIATMIEAPLTLQKTLTLPRDHLDACSAAQVPYTGNAAGNTVDLLDLSGENEALAPLPAGYASYLFLSDCFKSSTVSLPICEATFIQDKLNTTNKIPCSPKQFHSTWDRRNCI